MKKFFLALLLIATLGFGANAFAATTSVLPPNGVGTYNDFGQQVRLDINPSGTNASQFKIYYAPGYNATGGFKSFYVPATANIYINNIWYDRTGFRAPTMGWYTVKVVSVRADGLTSKPFTTNVDVMR